MFSPFHATRFIVILLSEPRFWAEQPKHLRDSKSLKWQAVSLCAPPLPFVRLMNTTSSSSSMFGATPLEVKAEQLAVLLRAGLDDEFGRQFQRDARQLSVQQAEALVALINMRLSSGTKKRELKIVVSERSSEQTTVMVMDRSRLFGNSWSIARQTYAI